MFRSNPAPAVAPSTEVPVEEVPTSKPRASPLKYILGVGGILLLLLTVGSVYYYVSDPTLISVSPPAHNTGSLINNGSDKATIQGTTSLLPGTVFSSLLLKIRANPRATAIGATLFALVIVAIIVTCVVVSLQRSSEVPITEEDPQDINNNTVTDSPSSEVDNTKSYIIGGVVGGIVVLLVIVFVVIKCANPDLVKTPACLTEFMKKHSISFCAPKKEDNKIIIEEDEEDEDNKDLKLKNMNGSQTNNGTGSNGKNKIINEKKDEVKELEIPAQTNKGSPSKHGPEDSESTSDSSDEDSTSITSDPAAQTKKLLKSMSAPHIPSNNTGTSHSDSRFVEGSDDGDDNDSSSS